MKSEDGSTESTEGRRNESSLSAKSLRVCSILSVKSIRSYMEQHILSQPNNSSIGRAIVFGTMS